MGFGGEADVDRVVGVEDAAAEDDGHDAGAAGFFAGAGGWWTPEMLLEAGAEVVDLGAGGAEAGDLEDGAGVGVGAEGEEGVGGEGEEVDAGGEDVFAEVAGGEGDVEGGELGEEFGGEEVNLAEVGEGGVLALEVEVLRGGAAVGVAFDAFACDEGQRGLGELGEGVAGIEGESEDFGHEAWVESRGKE
jgi:hypothetical protein